MDIRRISPFISVSPQLSPQDVSIAASQGFKAIINNRPDREGEAQPLSAEVEAAAKRAGLAYRHIPVVSGRLTDADVARFQAATDELMGPVLAFCRTGTRSATLWALSQAHRLDPAAILEACSEAGYDLSSIETRLATRARAAAVSAGTDNVVAIERARHHQVVIVGGGSGGIATAASLLRRRPDLDIVIIEPRDRHFYQPGWTLVGGGVFDRAQTTRPMADVMPKGVTWIRTAVAGFAPDRNEVVLDDGGRLGYAVLIVAPGLKLDWDRIDGLSETLGKNGVTSNYLFDMAPYTWELVQELRTGTALFTQPPMPIKCAGAPQKAMYLACDHWLRTGRIKGIEVGFYNAGGVLFGVPDYVPALSGYVQRYGADLNFGHDLVAVDGATKTAQFEIRKDDGAVETVERRFDMLHVCPPQTAPDFVRSSGLANDAGWVDVDPDTLQHTKFGNVFGLGDACSAPNAKTAAAVRKQAPVVAINALAVLDGHAPRGLYDGYGSCPLTVERGRIVLAEFGYGGKLAPTFPTWLIDGTKPSRLAWLLKEKLLPDIYWRLMLKGREWLAGPTVLPHPPTPHEEQEACDFKDPPTARGTSAP